MNTGRMRGESQGKKITLKMARNALRVTVDGRRRLDLSNMQMAEFPRCLLRLADVEELDLSRNRLQKLPEYIERFHNLRWLDLHSNRLAEIPASIGQLQGLLYLNLCNNQLCSRGLPEELGQLDRLRSLNLGMNRLESLPYSMATLRELRELGLFDNQLTQVPDCLRRLPHLRKLNVCRNPIRSPDDDSGRDPIRRVECFYLVDGDGLCETCTQKCREKLGRLDQLRSGVGHAHSSSVWLLTPNSVAKEVQALRQ
ncbi:leucine-rich repeat-containing protein 18 [Paramormyrops kingsleyae]|uniref:leucine-rich repeat-containing protein 18 n=1 Tax=Paramormyrops kingsleyae TaxID=1676925 RepID=UPI000CD63950|nr:leucine-rich repeat-containing protein 18-like [Paramormyrops kingsleyae]XP_023676297.1 leucine-rich repeat-containing protein 18-like [Paramormyrops kingsleyae]